jgi:hypothetical protein
MNQLALEAGFVAKLPNSPADGCNSCYLNTNNVFLPDEKDHSLTGHVCVLVLLDYLDEDTRRRLKIL